MMANRQLLTDEERQALLGIPLDPDGMARCFTLSGADRDLVVGRRRLLWATDDLRWGGLL
jgi:hypothetical protein